MKVKSPIARTLRLSPQAMGWKPRPASTREDLVLVSVNANPFPGDLTDPAMYSVTVSRPLVMGSGWKSLTKICRKLRSYSTVL